MDTAIQILQPAIEFIIYFALIFFVVFAVTSRFVGTGRRSRLSLHEHQIASVSRAHFEKRKLLNKKEIRVFHALTEVVAELNPNLRVMAQVNLGEFLSVGKNSGDWKLRKDAFASVNSKRVDFLLVDSDFVPVCALEYQGSGHYRENAFKRDAVKKEALRRAGIDYIEVLNGMKPRELRLRLEAVIGKPVHVVTQTSNSSTNRAFS